MGDITETLNEILQRVVRVETKIDGYNGLREKIDLVGKCQGETEARSKSNTHQIKEIKDNLTWLWRTIAGALIAAAITALVTLGGKI